MFFTNILCDTKGIPKGGIIIRNKMFNDQLKEQLFNSHLKDIKKMVAKRKFEFVGERKKNKKFMNDRGLNIDDVREEIFRLSIKDYVAGPEADRDRGRSGYVYKFKSRYITDEVIYIKIRYDPPKEVVCISFHEDQP